MRGGRRTICSTNPRIHLPNICTARSELCDLAVIFWRFSFDILVPSEQILGPGGQVGPGPNDFRQASKTCVRTFFPAILTDLPTYIQGSYQTRAKFQKKCAARFLMRVPSQPDLKACREEMAMRNQHHLTITCRTFVSTVVPIIVGVLISLWEGPAPYPAEPRCRRARNTAC